MLTLVQLRSDLLPISRGIVCAFWFFMTRSAFGTSAHEMRCDKRMQKHTELFYFRCILCPPNATQPDATSITICATGCATTYVIVETRESLWRALECCLPTVSRHQRFHHYSPFYHVSPERWNVMRPTRNQHALILFILHPGLAVSALHLRKHVECMVHCILLATHDCEVGTSSAASEDATDFYVEFLYG